MRAMSVEACSQLDMLSREPLHRYVNASGIRLPAGSIHIQGEPQPMFAPLESPFDDPLTSAMSTRLPASLLDGAFSFGETDEHVRRALVGGSRPKTIVVLGTSPTSGCGASEDVRNKTIRTAASQFLDGERACDATRSWAKIAFEQLHALLGAHGAANAAHSLSMSIWFKNAVEASYYRHCTARRVPREARVILLEIGCSVWSTNLRELVRTLRAQAPRAIIAFVTWSDRLGADRAVRNALSPARGLIRNAAMAEGADVVDVAVLLAALYRVEPEHRRSHFWRLWYALGGSDTIHPSPFGHALTAAAATRYLALRVAQAACKPTTTSDSDGALHAAAGATASPQRGRAQDAPVNASAASPHAFSASCPATGMEASLWQREEMCYDRADRLPFRPSQSVGWALIDEGGMKKVAKLGLVSMRVGDSLSLGPLPPLFAETSSSCEVKLVELGFLRSSRPGMGAISISCGPGCECTKQVAPFTDTLYPFPHVETDAALAPDPRFHGLLGAGRNVSVTETTAFLMRQGGPSNHGSSGGACMGGECGGGGSGGECFVHVRHVATKKRGGGAGVAMDLPASSAASRVRIDSLTARSLSPVEFVHTLWRAERSPLPSTRQAGVGFLSRAARCMSTRTRLSQTVHAWCACVRAGESVDGSLNVTLQKVCAEMSGRGHGGRAGSATNARAAAGRSKPSV